jgi:polar amino acid transport system permease protein
MIDWSLFNDYWPDLLSGARNTVLLWVAGSLLGIVIGFAGGLVLAGGPPGLRKPIRCYVELFRGTPLLVQLFLVYAGGPHIGIVLNALTVGIVGLGLYGGAYFTEIFRAGFATIPKGQIDAASSFGFNRYQTVRRIILPQMLLLSLPSIVNLLIFILKDTAVLSILTIPELTFQVTGMTLETFAFIEPYMALAIGYWLLVELTALAGRTAEHALKRRLGFLA